MEDAVKEYLNKRASELMVFEMPRNKTLMDEVFAFDPKNIESVSSAKLSEYTIGLAQFLIYFSSQINATKVKLTQKRRAIDVAVINSEFTAKTKAEKTRKVIDNDTKLVAVEVDILGLEGEVQMTENMEKYYIELINAFKRELTRRETELKLSRDGRRY